MHGQLTALGLRSTSTPLPTINSAQRVRQPTWSRPCSAAEEAGAVLQDADLVRLYRGQLAAGDRGDASETLRRISGSVRSAEGLDDDAWEHGLQALAIRPKLICHSLVGGSGNQVIRRVELTADGRAIGHGPGFTVTVDLATQHGFVTGNLDATDDEKVSTGGHLRKDWKRTSSHAGTLTDPRDGASYRYMTLQVHPILQQPWAERVGDWELWGWSHSEANGKSLMADSRLYRLWLLPDNRLGVLCWTDGGNTTLGRNPRDLNQRGMGGFGKGPRVMLARIDPTTGDLDGGSVQRGVVPRFPV